MDARADVPNPRTSGMNMPTTPVPIAAVSNRRVGDQPDLAAKPALYSPDPALM